MGNENNTPRNRQLPSEPELQAEKLKIEGFTQAQIISHVKSLDNTTSSSAVNDLTKELQDYVTEIDTRWFYTLHEDRLKVLKDLVMERYRAVVMGSDTLLRVSMQMYANTTFKPTFTRSHLKASLKKLAKEHQLDNDAFHNFSQQYAQMRSDAARPTAGGQSSQDQTITELRRELQVQAEWVASLTQQMNEMKELVNAMRQQEHRTHSSDINPSANLPGDSYRGAYAGESSAAATTTTRSPGRAPTSSVSTVSSTRHPFRTSPSPERGDEHREGEQMQELGDTPPTGALASDVRNRR